MITVELIYGALTWLASSIATMTAAALVLLCLQRLLGKTWKNPPLLHAAWLCILIKPLCPPLLSWPAAYWPVGSEVQQSVAVDAVPVRSSVIDTAASGVRSNREKIGQQADQYSQVKTNTASVSHRSKRIAGEPGLRNDGRHPAGITMAAGVRWTYWVTILVLLWWTVAASLMVRVVWQAARFGRRLSRLDHASAPLRRLVHQRLVAAGLCRMPSIRVTDDPLPPLVWAAPRFTLGQTNARGAFGVPFSIRPTLVLPRRLVQQTNPNALSAIIDHELSHLRRRDHWVRWIEAIVVAMFWCNPVVWIARAQMRRWEEVCCDAAASGRGTWHAAAYAKALLDAAERLSMSGVRRAAVDHPTDFSLTFGFDSLAERIVMLSHPLPHRLTLQRKLAFVTFASVFWLLSPFGLRAGSPSPSDQSDTANGQVLDSVSKPGPATGTRVTGRITDPQGQPIAGARVYVFTEEVDARGMFYSPRERNMDVQDGFPGTPPTPKRPAAPDAYTDAQGRYTVRTKAVAPHLVNVEVLAQGFARPSGLACQLRSLPVLSVDEGQSELVHDVTLQPSLYFAGVVTDQDGRPIEGVDVKAFEHEPGTGSWVTLTSTDEAGRFEIFNFCLTEDLRTDSDILDPDNALITFYHPDYLRTKLVSLRTLDPGQHAKLSVKLGPGRTVAGQVLDEGRPVANRYVSVSNANRYRLTKKTDQQGRFEFRGVVDGPLIVQAFDLNQWRFASKTLSSDQGLTGLQMEMTAGTDRPTDTGDVLGMKLVSMTPSMLGQLGLDTFKGGGVMVVDPGAEIQRLQIGGLKAGCIIGSINDEKPTADLQQLVAVLIDAYDTYEQPGNMFYERERYEDGEPDALDRLLRNDESGKPKKFALVEYAYLDEVEASAVCMWKHGVSLFGMTSDDRERLGEILESFSF